MKAIAVTVALATAAVCSLTTGCSSSSGGLGIPGSQSSIAAGNVSIAAGNVSAAAAGTSAAGSSSGGSAVTCKQVTEAEVQPLSTDPITQDTVTAESEGSLGTGQQCVLSGADGDGTVDILVLGGSGASNAYAEALTSETDGQVAVSGVGDKASRDKGDDQINAIKGNVYCSVTLGSDDTVPGVAAIEDANGNTSDIGAAADTIVAVALGTLCNRIWGSGSTTPDLSGLSAIAASASASASASSPGDTGAPSDTGAPTS
jgi:hypothetical protein